MAAADALPVVRRLEPAGGSRAGADTKEHAFAGAGIRLEPHECVLGAAGKRPTAVGAQASGVWRGTVAASGARDAADRVAPLLSAAVCLDSLGVLAVVDVDLSRELRFARASGDAAEQEGASGLGGEPATFRLLGGTGQVLSHVVHAWVSAATGAAGFDVVVRLQPRAHFGSPPSCLELFRPGPLGASGEVWEEVPMVELPQLLLISVRNRGAGAAVRSGAPRAADALAKPTGREGFLVEEHEEAIVIRCWRRTSDGAEAKPQALSLEQLLWHDALAALASAPACAEEPVPAGRVRLSDEGLFTPKELLETTPAGSNVPEEDAARLSSFSFLQQFVPVKVLEAEVLPRLFPGAALASGAATARIFSAELSTPNSFDPASRGAAAPRKPQSLDDIFPDSDDEAAKPAPMAAIRHSGADPLARHELTSVLLVSEQAGFAACFHCLSEPDL